MTVLEALTSAPLLGALASVLAVGFAAMGYCWVRDRGNR